MIAMIDINPSDIKDLMESYGLTDFEIPDQLSPNLKAMASGILASYVLWYANNGYGIDHSISTRLKEIPLLIQFLRTCEGSTLEIKGTITKPKGKQVKGTELTATISNQQFLTWLELFANTWFESQQDGLFQHKFGWEFKQPLTLREDLAPVYEEEQDPFFTEPYSDEELSQIIDYYDKLEKSHLKFSKNGELGRLADRIVSLMKSVCIDWKATKLYSFVYDIMLLGKCTGKECITEEGFSGDIGREKSQQVRNWLQAYDRDIGKVT